MPELAPLAGELSRLLRLEHPPVAVSFHDGTPTPAPTVTPPEPSGCCFWARAEHAALRTTAADHANCSVGSYTHGFISLADAASGEDTAALVGSGWVTEADLMAAPAVSFAPAAISYAPLSDVDEADVALIRLRAQSLMTLQGALPDLALVGKPQCQIVPLALSGASVVSAGCAVSRVRTGMPADELTCAIPAAMLADVVNRLELSRSADAAVSAYADADIRENFTRS